MSASDSSPMGAGGTITASGSSTQMRSESPLRPGDLVGRYVVLSRVGAGGMGVVYAAYDPELDRNLALKLLHADEPSDARARRQQRLVREAKALARLDHPNVVTVHDVGSHGDRVYLAMEFVEGETLTLWRRGRSRSWREILDVFVAAGRGLAAAHERGLVHRDFKPDNVMVGPRVRVMDFGLARAAQSTPDASAIDPPADITHRSLAGTPAYMAPETIRRDPIDTFADQFSFCVALWETLYDQHPFPGETPAEIAINVAAGNVRVPPRGRSVPRWLRSVCQRGLARDPTQRYENMHALVAALERGHGRSWRTRAIAGLAVVAVVGASAAWLRDYRHVQALAACEVDGRAIAAVWNEARRDELRAGMAASGLPGVESEEDRVQPWLDAHAERWATARTEVCVSGLDDPEWNSERVDAAVWCLDDSKREVDALIEAIAHGEPGASVRAVQAVAALAPVDPCLDADVTRRLPIPAPEQREAIAAVQRELFRADALADIGAYEQGLAVVQAALPPAEEIGWAPLVAATRFRLGIATEATGDFDEAETILEEAYFEAVNAGSTVLAVQAAHDLAYTVGYRHARAAEAMRWWRQGDALDREVPDPTGVRRGRSLANLAMLHRLAGNYTEAKDAGLRAVGLLEAALGPDHPELASTLTALANAHYRMGELEVARDTHERALAIIERLVGPDHPDVAMALDNLGGPVMAMGDHAGSLRLRERALRIREAALGPDHPDVSINLGHIANIHLELEDYARARPLFERALAIQERTLGPDDLIVAKTLTNFAALHHAMGDAAAARRLLERAVAIAEAKLGPDHAELAIPLQALGNVLVREGQTARARVVLERAQRLVEAASGNEHPMLIDVLEPLAEIALAEGRPEDALTLGERALQLRGGKEDGSLDLADLRFVLAQALAETGRDPARARSLAERARATYMEAGQDAAAMDRWLAAR